MPASARASAEGYEQNVCGCENHGGYIRIGSGRRTWNIGKQIEGMEKRYREQVSEDVTLGSTPMESKLAAPDAIPFAIKYCTARRDRTAVVMATGKLILNRCVEAPGSRLNQRQSEW